MADTPSYQGQSMVERDPRGFDFSASAKREAAEKRPAGPTFDYGGWYGDFYTAQVWGPFPGNSY